MLFLANLWVKHRNIWVKRVSFHCIPSFSHFSDKGQTINSMPKNVRKLLHEEDSFVQLCVVTYAAYMW